MKPLVALLLLVARIAPGGDLRPLSIDLDEIREGDLPREIFVIDGSFQIKVRETGKVIEISGEQREVEAGAVVGPSTSGAAMIEARILASKAGRSFPRFGVGVHGQTGYRLYVVPARKELHLVKNDEVILAAPFDWKSGSPLMLRLTSSPADNGKWEFTGKAWTAGTPEPAAAQIRHKTTSRPTRGQSSIWGAPYSGTPIGFDRIKVGFEG